MARSRFADTVVLALGFVATAPALAQQTERTLPEVQVRSAGEPESAVGPDRGYAPARSATATKTDTPLAETPAALTVLTRERIEDQGATGLQDALNYAAGVRSDAYGLDSRSDNVRVRGGYPDEYRDGLRRLFGYYTSNTRIEPYLLERIEVLRGPASMLFGQGTTAGVVNMVSKRPLTEAQRELGLQVGSFNRRQVQGDITGPVNQEGDLLSRLVFLYRESDTQVDHVRDDRRVVAPSLTWKPDGMTSLTLQLNWQQDLSGSTSQFFPWSGVVLPNPNGQIPTNRFIGQPGLDRYDSERFEGGWLFEHHFNDRWTVRQNFRLARNEVEYFSVYSDSFTNPNAPYTNPGQSVLDRWGFFERRVGHILAADQHVEGRLRTGIVQHQLLAGLDLIRHREQAHTAFDSPISQGGTVPPIDVYNPVYPAYAPPPLAAGPRSTTRQTGVYLQDQMKVGSRWFVVAGVRHDRAVRGLAGAADERDDATSLRGGLMFLAGNGFNPYVSYSESFTPLAGTDVNGQRWKPLRGEQIEAGFKWQPPGRRLGLNAAAYELNEVNRQVPDPNNALNQIQVGQTRTRGIELEAVGRVLPRIDVSAHYNYTSLDRELEALPANQAAVWGTYRFADVDGLRAGLGVRYLSDFRDGAAPTTPSVTLLDGMLGYDVGQWRLKLNVQNLTDEVYVSTCLGRGDCWFGARRTVVLSTTYRF